MSSSALCYTLYYYVQADHHSTVHNYLMIIYEKHTGFYYIGTLKYRTHILSYDI